MRFLTALLALAPLLHAQTNVSDQFYNAIRADNKAAVTKLLTTADANTRDARGTTPLMYAAAVGSVDMMRQLLTAGADAKAKNTFDSTALMWCTNNLEKVRLLIEKGADVNAHSKQGRTPLVIAAAHDGNIEVIRLLIKGGADLKAPGPAGASAALVAASGANDTVIMKLMVESGADVNAKDPAGYTALINAAGWGNLESVKMLLAHKAGVNAVSNPTTHEVKNGPLGIGSLTPLLMSVTAGSPEVVQALLNAGADLNVPDVRGMTAVMLAVATDHPNEKIVRMLLAKQPKMDVKSKVNETALDWALKFQNPSILPLIQKASVGVEPAKHGTPPITRANLDARQAVEKSVALMQKTVPIFLREGGCVACHAQNVTSEAVAAARARGLRVDEAAATEVARGTRLQNAAFADGMLERLDPPTVEITIRALMGLSAERVEPDRIIDAMVLNTASQQHADGTWLGGGFGIMRPPTADSAFSVTAYAIRVLRGYTPPGHKAEFDERIARAAKWLAKTEPLTTEDVVTQLLGIKWSGGTTDRYTKRVEALQRSDGGWAQTPYLKSDAYATGTALYALKEAGVPASDAAYKKGVAFLLSTQAPDGSWYVASRAPKFQPYFEGGFPYGHDEWISQWATAYAAISLSHALPEVRAAK